MSTYSMIKTTTDKHILNASAKKLFNSDKLRERLFDIPYYIKNFCNKHFLLIALLFCITIPMIVLLCVGIVTCIGGFFIALLSGVL